MMTIAVARGADEFVSARQRKLERLDREIADAQAGAKSKVSRAAAARYLDMSLTTLGELMKAGKGPPHIKNDAASAAMNQHIHFPWPELVTWDQARTVYSSPEQREQLQEESKRVALRRELADLEAQAATLRRALRESGDRRIMAFDGVAALTEPHPWIFDGDRLLGHALIVSDDDLEDGDWVYLSLEDALLEDWVDLERHEHFTAAFVGALNAAIGQAQSYHKRLRLLAEANKHHRDDDRGIRRDL
jgi:hypothetical protein